MFSSLQISDPKTSLLHIQLITINLRYISIRQKGYFFNINFQKSEEIVALEARINELTEIASAAEDSHRQIEEFKVQMQVYEAELARHAEEKESTNAVLKEVGR